MPSSSKEKQREYDRKRAGKRSRNILAIFYPEDLPEDGIKKIQSLGVKGCYIIHDKDKNEDGTPKKLHGHLILCYSSVKTLEQVEGDFKGLFGESENGSIIGVAKPQFCADIDGSIRYFQHIDDPEKAQYSFEDIKPFNGFDVLGHVNRTTSETKDMMVAIEQFIDDKKITEYTKLCRLLRSDYPEWYLLVTTRYTRHFTAYITSCRNMQKEDQALQEALEEGRAYMDEETGEIKYKKGD